MRPRIEQTGPREFIVTVYALDMGSAAAAREVGFRAAVERTITRARHEVERLVAELVAELKTSPQVRIRTDDPKWTDLLARIA